MSVKLKTSEGFIRNSFFPNHGLRKRKKRCDWSSGTVTSKRPLFVVGVSTTEGQLVKLGFVVDSRTKPGDVSGQEMLMVVELVSRTERLRQSGTLVLRRTSTVP